MARILAQLLLIVPALSAAGVLPMLLLSAPELWAEGKWRGAAFNLAALPGLIALLASILLPYAWQRRTGVRVLVVAGLLMAGAACVLLAHIMLVGPEGRFSPPESAIQFALIGGPLIVVTWNLRRLTGRSFAVLAGICGLGTAVLLAWMLVGDLQGCTRDYDASTGEHTACR
jgi:hypothetical protein